MAKMSKKEKELELRARELDKENRRLNGDLQVANIMISGLKKQVLEYQYRAGEKQRPLTELTLSDYIAGVRDPSRRKEFIGREYIISDAVLKGLEKRIDFVTIALDIVCPLLIPISRDVLRYLRVELDGETTKHKFVYHGTSKNLDAVEKEIASSKGKNLKAIVMATSPGNYFIEGFVEEDGKYLRFDNL